MTKIGRDSRRVYFCEVEISLVKMQAYIVFCCFVFCILGFILLLLCFFVFWAGFFCFVFVFCMMTHCKFFQCKRELKHKFEVVSSWYIYHREGFRIAWVAENQERKSWREKFMIDWKERGLVVPKSVHKHLCSL